MPATNRKNTSDRSQDRNQALTWARSEGLEPPTF